MDKISDEEAQETRELLAKFYGPIALTWSINHRMYEALGQLVLKSEACTRAMHLVPRPWDLSNPAKWATRQVRQGLVRFLNSPEGRHYQTCITATAAGMRRRFDEASLGL